MKAAVLRGLIAALGYLPLPVSRGLGWIVGMALWLFPNPTRRTAQENLQRCYPQQSARERKRRCRHSLVQLGQTLTDSCWVWTRSREQLVRAVRAVSGGAVFAEARARGRGVIVVSPHIGCWEMVGPYCAEQMTLTVLYRPPRLAALETVMKAGRERSGYRLAATDGRGIRSLYKALNAGQAIGILPDQAPRPGHGVLAPFFGHPARTMTLLPRLARASDAAVVFCVMERLPRGQGFHLHVLAASEAVKAPDDVTAATAVNRDVERCVALCPDQYMWGYRRFRRTGTRSGAPDGA